MVDIVLGTFFGDEAKGQCVNNLCCKDSIVVRFSGANQVGHNVIHDNFKHCFRNFGSGTLKGVPTYWSEYCICDLHTVLIEIAELQQIQIVPKIIFSPLCELVTPFDVISQWNNKENRSHGTVGTGFKSTLDRIKNGYSLTILDATNLLVLKEKVYNIGRYYYKYDSEGISVNINDWIVAVNRMANTFELRNLDILNNYEHLIFEGSQGILLDQKHGVMPFCTPSNTTSKNAFEILKKIGRQNDCPIVDYVCRPYITRHGEGPLLTTTKILDISDKNNLWNDFQRSFRACEFDINLLKHVLNIDYQYSENATHRLIFSHGKEVPNSLIQKIISETNISLIQKFEYEDWLD